MTDMRITEEPEDNNKYWWLQKDPKKIVATLESYDNRWVKRESNPICAAWNRNLLSYYSTILEPNDWQSALSYQGEQGEIVKMSIPTARTLIRQIVTLTTKDRLAFTALAETDDVKVAEALKLCDARIEEIIETTYLDAKRQNAAEHTNIFGIGVFKACWRTDKGVPYLFNPKVEGGQDPSVEYTGDCEITNPTVFDMLWDTRLEHPSELNWIRFRTKKNRHDLIAQFPHLRDRILNVPSIAVLGAGQGYNYDFIENEDLIYVYEALHKPTPAVPEGRMVIYSDSDTVYLDDINHYGDLGCEFVIPEPIPNSLYGYPKISDLLPAQEMFDHSVSAIATNESNGAVVPILVPRGAEISSEQIKGANYITYTPQNVEGGGEPKTLQLFQSRPESYKFADMMDKYMTSVSLLNSTIRGNPPAGLTSGTAVATMSANALEFMDSLQKSLDIALEKTVERCMKYTVMFAKTKRKISMKGSNNRAIVKDYTGDDLSVFKKIKIQRTNAFMSSIAGRADVADKLLAKGMIKDPQMYFSVLEGQPLNVMFKKELSQNDLIQSENDDLMNNKHVPVIITDDHASHIYHHAMLMNDPTVRREAQYLQNVLNHIMEHRQYINSPQSDPVLAAIIKTGLAPQMAPPPPGGPQEGAGPQPGPGPGQGEQNMNPPVPGDIAKPTQDQLGRMQ